MQSNLKAINISPSPFLYRTLWRKNDYLPDYEQRKEHPALPLLIYLFLKYTKYPFSWGKETGKKTFV